MLAYIMKNKEGYECKEIQRKNKIKLGRVRATYNDMKGLGDLFFSYWR